MKKPYEEQISTLLSGGVDAPIRLVSAGPVDDLDEEMDPPEQAHSLPRLRARLLEALNREDFPTIQRELPQYQELLEEAARSGTMSPERQARLESEHQRFHEQLRATLLTARISLRLEIERVRASRQYTSGSDAHEAIDLHG